MSEQIPVVLQSVFRELPGVQVRATGPRRARADLHPDRLPTLLELLKGRAGYLHLSAISCVDWPANDEFELVYHLVAYETPTLISAHIRIPRDPGQYVSVYDIHAPAGFFERDIHEMFGIHFEGAPNMEPFILTEWQGPPPMRKDFSTIDHVNATYAWQEYGPEWLKELEANGGGFVE